MEKTKFLDLNKPGYEHLADIAVLNENFQKIDDDASKRQKELEDHKIKKVSVSEDGHMTKEDKKKIDGIATGANNYIHPDTPTVRHVADSDKENWNGKEDAIAKKSGFNLDKTDITEDNTNKLFTAKGALSLFNTLTTSIQNIATNLSNHILKKASINEDGHMAKEDKAKLNRIAVGADNTSWNETVNSDIYTPIEYMRWNNYGKGHVIFDSSSGKSPNGMELSSSINSVTSWGPTYPTLMGWNGQDTYGVRVDSCRVADTTADNSHNHIISNVTGLQDTLDSKFNTSGGTVTGPINAVKISSIGSASSFSWSARSNSGFHTGDGNGMPLVVPDGSVFVKGYQIETVILGKGYIARSSLGHLRNNESSWGKTCLYFEGDQENQAAKHWCFNHDNGAIESQGGIVPALISANSGAAGYRVYADGYKEAWGQVYLYRDESERWITLPITFSTMNYNISTNTMTDGVSVDVMINASRINGNTITYRNNFVTTPGTGNAFWYVCGY